MGAGTLALAACGGGNAGTSTLSEAAVAASAKSAKATTLVESASGTTVPSVTAIVDGNLIKWTLSSGKVMRAGVNTGCPVSAALVLYWNHTIYARNANGTWYINDNNVWKLSADPRLTSGPIFYGMNGHPLDNVGAFATQTPAQQIATLVDLGVTVYRLDCYGATSDAQTILTYAQLGAANGITIVPCFAMSQPMMMTSEQDNYNWAYQCGINIASVLSAYCPIYEIGNEIDQWCSIGVGETAASFDNTRYQLVRGFLRGAADGIHSVQPNAKIIRGGCVTTEVGFNNMLWNGTQPDGTTGHPALTWDYTGWHWYETSGNIVTAYDGTSTSLNVLQNLQQYGVPVWLTEVGFNAGDSDQGAAYIQSALAEYVADRTTYNIAGVCFYELYDLAAEGANYGLIASDGVTKKLGYTAFKNFTTANPA
jgi:hypothetical protein